MAKKGRAKRRGATGGAPSPTMTVCAANVPAIRDRVVDYLSNTSPKDSEEYVEGLRTLRRADLYYLSRDAMLLAADAIVSGTQPDIDELMGAIADHMRIGGSYFVVFGMPMLGLTCRQRFSGTDPFAPDRAFMGEPRGVYFDLEGPPVGLDGYRMTVRRATILVESGERNRADCAARLTDPRMTPMLAAMPSARRYLERDRDNTGPLLPCTETDAAISALASEVAHAALEADGRLPPRGDGPRHFGFEPLHGPDGSRLALYVTQLVLLAVYYATRPGLASLTHPEETAVRADRRVAASVRRDPRPASAVNIVDLRPAPDDGGGRTDPATGREYSCRWIVRGHYAMQAYGPNRSLRRRIYIDPYIKGPADKPLVIRTPVYRA